MTRKFEMKKKANWKTCERNKALEIIDGSKNHCLENREVSVLRVKLYLGESELVHLFISGSRPIQISTSELSLPQQLLLRLRATGKAPYKPVQTRS